MIRRDRVTLVIMALIPISLMLLFGYALNNTPRDLSTAWIAAEETDVAQELRAALERTGFFRITRTARTAAEADGWMKSGEVVIVVEVPPGFERALRRGERPSLLVAADASDPVAMASALAALEGVKAAVLKNLRGLPEGGFGVEPFEMIVHRRFNPEGSTRLHIVPGLLGMILNITMLVFTAVAVTREYERGTMEGLLAKPVRPLEIMIGTMMPYILLGAIQAVLIVAVAYFVFDVPIVGSLLLLAVTTMLFIITNLAIGYSFSTVSENQLQAMQMTFMFFLPNVMLSGLIFPFDGMPRWAQSLSEWLPLTHFVRISRGLMLKGSDADAIAYDTLALAAATVVAMIIAVMRYRQTLD